jgi:hypothetical protein
LTLTRLAFVALVFSGCQRSTEAASAVHHLSGSREERVSQAVAILLPGAVPPSPIVDAQCAEERIGDGFLGPSDRRTFCVLQVAPPDLERWPEVLEGEGRRLAHPAPGSSLAWWPTPASFTALEPIDTRLFTGLGQGWAAIERKSGRIYTYSFST